MNVLTQSQPDVAPHPPIGPYLIGATDSLQNRRPQVLKHGDTFAVFDHTGDLVAGHGSPDGLYHRDTRHLSHFALALDGRAPMLLSADLRGDEARLTCDLTNADVTDEVGEIILEHDQLHIRRVRLLWNGACIERIAVKSYLDAACEVRLSFHFAADFADLFEVRGAQRKRRGHLHDVHCEDDCARLAYTGLDGIERSTSLTFDPAPEMLEPTAAHHVLSLGPGERCAVYVAIRCNPGKEPPDARRLFFTALREAHRAARESRRRSAAISSSNETFNETVSRSVADLTMLSTQTPSGPYPYAGIPWFSTVFGRDGLITAMLTLWTDPALARGVLGHLAANQATEVDPAADAEPGKILHELRHGEMAELGEVPFRRYYGSVDSTPLFLMLAGDYLERTGDLSTIRSLWPNIEAALNWIDQYGDADGDGFVEYHRPSENGLVNQGWKDSHDSIFHEDGTMAEGPIALCEVQGYVYRAWQGSAKIAQRLGYLDRALSLEKRAERLRRDFDDAFFDPELGLYVLALDGEKKPCRVRASNAGHALLTGIAYPERAPQVIENLMSPSMFSGWGVRTLATDEKRYNPMSYHNGSVWPHDNAMIAAGFARYGRGAEAALVLEGLSAAATFMDLRRLPELFCGFPRRRGIGPTAYPVACAPQAWAAAAPLSLLQSSLGLSVRAQERAVVFERPTLPRHLDSVSLSRLSIGRASVDLTVSRAGRGVVVGVDRRVGECRVVTTS